MGQSLFQSSNRKSTHHDKAKRTQTQKMGLLLFFGSSLVALGPPLAVFFMLVATNDQMTILSIGSAFFWLIGITLAALFWFAAWPIQYWSGLHVVVSCVFQELARYVFYRLYVKAEKLLRPSDSSLSNRLLAALVTWKATGPGTLFSAACPGTNLFVVNAFMALFFGVLHVALAMLAFEAYRQLRTKTGISLLIFVFVAHLSASLSSLLNKEGGSCAGALIITLVISLVSLAVASITVHRALIHHIR